MLSGEWLAAASAAVAVTTAFVLRRRVSRGVGLGILALSGAGLGWAGMLIQPKPSAGEVAAAIGLLAILVPAHARIVLGPFGSRR